MIISVYSPVSGIGRTTIAVNTAAALAATGKKVVLFDFNYGELKTGLLTGSCDQTISSFGFLDENLPVDEILEKTGNAIGSCDQPFSSLTFLDADIPIEAILESALTYETKGGKMTGEGFLKIIPAPQSLGEDQYAFSSVQEYMGLLDERARKLKKQK